MRRLLVPAVISLALCAALLALAPPARGTIRDGFLERIYKNEQGATMPYRLFVPPGYDAKKKYPLVLWLHGSAGRGNDNLLQISGGNTLGSHVWTTPENQSKYPAFVLAPQCPADVFWATRGDPDHDSAQEALVLEILAALEKEFSIDAKRLYISGQSMGGEGTWDLILRHPDIFAAAIPLCGFRFDGGPFNAKVVTKVPIWAFQGLADEVVPAAEYRAVIEAVRAAGGKPQYTEYPGVGHNVWLKAFAEPELLPWVFAQHR
jgi:predicted peptidase